MSQAWPQVMEQVIAARVAGFADGAVLPVTTEMSDIALDVLLACLFSGDLALDKARFTAELNALFVRYSSPHVLDLTSAPRWVPRVGHGRRDRIIRGLRAQVAQVLAARRARPATDEEADDLLSLLLRAGHEDGAPLDDEEIIDNLLTFLAAGHETSARSLAWTFYLLSRSDDARARVEDELDAVDLDATPPDQWEERLPYLTAVLKESMRLYPAATMLSRVAMEADQLGAHFVKPGAGVYTAPWVLHRHRALWRAPDVFDPERFLGEEATRIHRFAYIPFGAGPRVCIGGRFAMQEMIIILARCLSCFRFRHVGAQEPSPVAKITLRPSTDLPMRLERRR